jgi:hypothetical protein
VKGYVETTILTDCLLKAASSNGAGAKALAVYESTQLPVYAIKEFKAGPLLNFVYIHNKIATHGLAGAIGALQRLSLTPQKYKTATSIQALRECFSRLEGQSMTAIAKQHGDDANEAITALVRANIANMIRAAWHDRHSIATKVVEPLSQYMEKAPTRKQNGLFDLEPTRCEADDCCMAPLLRRSIPALQKMRAALKAAPTKAENLKRSKALKQIIKHPGEKISEETCRALGDAVFALCCPVDHDVLTTNLRDHRPLCRVLGKEATNPYDPTL